MSEHSAATDKEIPSTEFSSLPLRAELLGNLGDLGYEKMTLVQAQALPLLLSGVDILARAKTGSGKTAAFGLGLLNALDATAFNVQGLVLCPTRELADQVAKELRRLARAIPNIKILTLCGGSPLRNQVNSLQRSPHVVVGTPGRIHKHLRSNNIDLGKLQTLVLDEADRMLDMGFMDEVDAILRYVPADRQTSLFSATYPDAIADMSARVQRDATIVDVTEKDVPAEISQVWFSVTRENRKVELLRALKAWGGELNLVFCNTKIDCAEVERFLKDEKIVAVALHGDLDQPRRNQVLVRFSNRSASVLVATDVAARGIDVKDVDVVFNYELPPQGETYVHRIGRTGRAGQSGAAISLVEEREAWRLLDIEKAIPTGALQKRDIPKQETRAESLLPKMSTIRIDGGRKNKLRPGDLLGALTAANGIPGTAVGQIDLFETCGYVAIQKQLASAAQRQLNDRPIKGRKYRARMCR